MDSRSRLKRKIISPMVCRPRKDLGQRERRALIPPVDWGAVNQDQVKWSRSQGRKGWWCRCSVFDELPFWDVGLVLSTCRSVGLVVLVFVLEEEAWWFPFLIPFPDSRSRSSFSEDDMVVVSSMESVNPRRAQCY